jgi:uncharacterized membrane protein YidH (DUF202 family)
MSSAFGPETTGDGHGQTRVHAELGVRARATANELSQERTALATDRTLMAADRSLMAWIRTALSMISFGFTIYKLLQGFAARAPSSPTPAARA